MSFNFSNIVSKEANSAVNKALQQAQNYALTSVHKTARNFISNGAEKLLNDIGAPQLVREAVRNVNAEVVQAAVASAGNIFRGLVDGVITSTDLSKLEFLDAVQAAIKRNDPLARDILNLNLMAQAARDVTKERPPELNVDPHSSPYATDFTDYFNPKFSFLFAVEFIFNPPFNQNKLFAGTDTHTLIYNFERPTVEIQHEEVNMYNFMTQVPVRIKYNPVSFTAHDDGKSNVLSVLVGYLRTLSPIFNIDASNGSDYEHLGGMTFSEDENSSHFGTVQQGLYKNNLEELGIFEENIKSIFKQINIYHVYDFGKNVDVYKFFNPKITNIQLDKLTMQENSTNSITVEFVYDGLYIDYGKSPADVIKFSDLNFSALHNMVNRNVAYGNLLRAEQLRQFQEQQKNAARQRSDQGIVEFQALLQQAAINENLDISNDAAVEQYLRDRQYNAEIQRIQQSQNLNNENFINSFKIF